MAAVGLGDLTKARAYSEEAVALARELGSRRELAVALNALAQLHRMEGQLDVAEPLYEEVLSLFRELGDQECNRYWPSESGHGFYRSEIAVSARSQCWLRH